jgi:SAM-dependent methyltransferase
MGVKTLIWANKFFRAPAHPFNTQSGGGATYAEWQFERGGDTVRCYSGWRRLEEEGGPEAMFRGKDVLDIGCGAAGKTVYYATLGAGSVVGVDILEKYRSEAEGLAERKGVAGKFSFACCDASKLAFPDGSFDTVVMNDAMEHVADPEGSLRECMRVLRPAGRLYVNFPPYGHPYGAHLSDAIAIPWVHLFFSERSMVEAYKKLVAGLPDGSERVALRFAARPGGGDRIAYINKMSISRFKRILKRAAPWARLAYYRELPLRGFLAAPAKLPGVKELFVRMVVAVIEKPAQA